MYKKAVFISFFMWLSLSALAQKTDYRPIYHYTPPKNWVNDPNGLVYLDGEYHLFYQYNPFGDKWGHMSWGHAVSRDLYHWQNLHVALPEFDNTDGSKTMIFSGCAVVDSLNTSGFFKKGFRKGLVAVFTSHIENKAQHQSLAFSSDKGRTWTYYNHNPILDLGMKDFRDPNVIWYPERQVWIMSVVKPFDHLVQFYESKDLKKWELLSEFGKKGDLSKIWECPSLTKVPIENTDKSKWVLMVSCGHKQGDYPSMQYFVGDFDGKNFSAQEQAEPLYVDEGRDYYAAIPFFNLPKKHKNPIMMGWINNWDYARDIPTQGYRGGFSVPRVMSVKMENGQFRLVQKPLNGYFKTEYSKNNLKIKDTFTPNFKGNSYQFTTDIDLANAEGFEIELLKNGNEKSVISFDKNTNTLSFDRTKSGNVGFSPKFASVETMNIKPINNHINLRILVDKSIVEIFANGKSLTDMVFPLNTNGGISISSINGILELKSLSISQK